MPALESNTSNIFGIHIRESANDGSDFSNAASDYRVLFVGEDGLLHLKDSAGTVTTPSAGGAITSSAFTMATDRLLGRDTASTGAIEEITIGSGLSLSGGALSASGAAGALASARYIRTAGDYTLTGGTSSTVWSDVDGTNLSLTISTGARRCMISLVASGGVSNAAGALGLDVTVDGTRQGGAQGGILLQQQHATASEIMNFSFNYITDTLSAASHTFNLQWLQANTAHTATLRGSDPYLTFSVVELYA